MTINNREDERVNNNDDKPLSCFHFLKVLRQMCATGQEKEKQQFHQNQNQNQTGGNHMVRIS